MRLIAHRGNLDGPDSRNENTPKQIINAINNGFEVEVDLWYKNKKFYLGHDGPKTLLNQNTSKGLLLFNLLRKFGWCHAKSIEALNALYKNGFHCFFHDIDDAVLTSKGFIWTFPGKPLTENSIAVMPEINMANSKIKPAGICSDFVRNYKVGVYKWE